MTQIDLGSIDLYKLVAAAVIGIVVIKYMSYAKGNVHLPGPTPWPIFGNLTQLGKDAALTFHEWSKVYGDVFKVTLGEREVVIINSAQATKELLSDQGGAYISRPTFHNFHSVLSSSAGNTIGTSPWDDSCKKKRKAAATALNKTYVQQYVPIVERETLALIEDLNTHGKGGKVDVDPAVYMSRFALNTSLAVNYGCRFDGIDDQLLSEIIYVESNVSGVRSVTAAWSDYVPLLRYIPKGNTVSHTEDIRRRRDKYMGLLLDDLKDSIKKGTDVPCITGNILKDPEVKLTPLELSSICLSMVSAGLDTLGNTMIWTVGFLAQHPQIWEKAYAEVNKVFDGAVPDCDTESVEYITAIYREALRYFSVLKLSLPRATIGESEYKGVVIPDGTTVFLNAWAVHHDESRYGDVDVFRPERFMEEKEDGSSQAHYSFGAGRRMCAGVHLANRELYSAISKLVYFFKLEEGDVPYGCDPAKDVHNTYALAHTPHKYKMRFVARDPEMLERWIQDEKGRNELKLAGSIGKKA